MAVMYSKGTEVRALLFVLVPEGQEIKAAGSLASVAVAQQWTANWSIKRIDVINLTESRRLPGKYAPAKGMEFNLSIAVKAARQDILVNEAFPKILQTLGLKDPTGGVLYGSLGADW